MRIIGGDLRGKMILPPNGYKARPTTDFAKEGLFNTLINEFDFEELEVLDLFSGTGSISYEFASRGVQKVISVEMNPFHCNFIKRCASDFKLKNMQVVHHNVFDFLEICKVKFDIIFADPPYDIDGLDNIPTKVFNKELVKEGGYLILEHPDTYSFTEDPRFVKEKKYGNVHFSYFRG